MLKPIFDEDVDFFSKKIILCAKSGDFKNGALDSDLCLSTLNLINQRNVPHIKLSMVKILRNSDNTIKKYPG